MYVCKKSLASQWTFCFLEFAKKKKKKEIKNVNTTTIIICTLTLAQFKFTPAGVKVYLFLCCLYYCFFCISLHFSFMVTSQYSKSHTYEHTAYNKKSHKVVFSFSSEEVLCVQLYKQINKPYKIMLVVVGFCLMFLVLFAQCNWDDNNRHHVTQQHVNHSSWMFIHTHTPIRTCNIVWALLPD